MVTLSVLLATARDDYSIINTPDVHLFSPTVKSLQKQTFKDFEFILVDGLYEQRRDFFEKNAVNFKVKHVPPKPSPYLARGQWSVCNFLNTGLIHASGDYVLRLDDTDEFDEDFLENNMRYLQVGYFPLAMQVYYRGNGRPALYDDETRKYYADQVRMTRQPLIEESIQKKLEILDSMYDKGTAIRDSRYLAFGDSYAMRAHWNQAYGNMALPMKVLLEVNGYDEAFDGKKSLEDPDLGLRVTFNNNNQSKYMLDKRLTVIEYFHGPVSTKVLWSTERPACCNYAILKLHERKHTVRVNERKFDDEELKEIRMETVMSPCSHVNGADYDVGKGFDWWAANVPIFDLKEMRKETLEVKH